MAALKAAFESWGYRNARTLLASGNVLFDAPRSDQKALARKVEGKIKETFGFEVGVIVWSLEEIQNLAAAQPFQGVKVSPLTRLYVTLLGETPKSTLKIPYESPEKDFHILRVSDGVVFSVLTLSPQRGTVDAMNVLEKEFGKKVTTRNWNTITRILKN